MRKYALIFIALFLSSVTSMAQTSTQKLPAPEYTSTKPLNQLLSERSSSRAYSKKELSKQDLSNLLWAAFGINRPESGKRTAPTAMNWQDITLYLALETGVYYYEPQEHALIKVLDEDVRKETGSQDFVQEVPVNIVYVSDFDRMGNATSEQKKMYSAAHTGFIGQNVYLFCTSYGLNTVFRGAIDRDLIHKTLQLKPNQHVVYCQSVGWPPIK
ncbi:MAG: SagB/ThcOx family dehydrogenase [Bacteroidales bacterium]